VARIAAALRIDTQLEKDVVMVFGNLDIDLAQRLVKKNGETVVLTATEYSLLAFLQKMRIKY
jgi:DNA-binding response OmpR family regulator